MGKREDGFAELDNILNTLTRHVEGFRGYMSMVSHQNTNTAVVLTLWQDENALKNSEAGIFAQAVEKVRSSLESTPKVENFRVFSTELFQSLKE
jgi:heme-degrading monooxygenase HmoA